MIENFPCCTCEASKTFCCNFYLHFPGPRTDCPDDTRNILLDESCCQIPCCHWLLPHTFDDTTSQDNIVELPWFEFLPSPASECPHGTPQFVVNGYGSCLLPKRVAPILLPGSRNLPGTNDSISDVYLLQAL